MNNMFNPALYHPTMAAVAAEQQSRFYSQFYRTMAIAAVHQQQQQQLQQQPAIPRPPPPPPPQSSQPRPKRRRTSAGNDPSAPPSHLSGEMIRRLREKQKMKNAAAVASAVATVAAVTTSGGRQFDTSKPARDATSPAPSTSSTSRYIKELFLPPIFLRQCHLKTGVFCSNSTSNIVNCPAKSMLSSPTGASAQPLTASGLSEGQPLTEMVKPAPPLMSSRDMTTASLEETVINGQAIPCFNIGGEMRLCFPQILKQTLSAFHMEQICLACEELLIHVAPATNQQLSALKGANVLPVTASQCGLITKSDAERLAAYLMTSKHQSSSNAIEARLSSENEQDSNLVIHVQHECFGKASGALYPSLYKSPNAKCISCAICGKINQNVI